MKVMDFVTLGIYKFLLRNPNQFASLAGYDVANEYASHFSLDRYKRVLSPQETKICFPGIMCSLLSTNDRYTLRNKHYNFAGGPQ